MTIRQCAGPHCAAARRTHEYFVPFAEFSRRFSGNLFPSEILRAAERGRHGRSVGRRRVKGWRGSSSDGASLAAREIPRSSAVSRRGGVRDLRIPMHSRGGGGEGERGYGEEANGRRAALLMHGERNF